MPWSNVKYTLLRMMSSKSKQEPALHAAVTRARSMLTIRLRRIAVRALC